MIDPLQIRTLPAETIVGDTDAWPRRGLDEERAAEFMNLYAEEGVDALPPIQVVAASDRQFLIADGWHRATAQLRLGVDPIRAVVIDPPPGRAPEDVAYERALHTAARASKPLSRAEKRTAIARLIEERSQASDREIARLVGVDHKTVGAIRRQLGSSPEAPGAEDGGPGEHYLVRLAAGEIARRLVRDTQRLWDARGLGEMMLGDRIGAHLANALVDEHDEGARDWALRIQAWATAAIAQLDRES
jgi:hypothetical protein